MPHEFDKELAQMAAADAEAQQTLDSLHDDLEHLRRVRYCVSRIRPEFVGEKLSILELPMPSKQRMPAKQSSEQQFDKRSGARNVPLRKRGKSLETNQIVPANVPPPVASTFTRIIDGKIYLVRMFFTLEGAETMEQKILRMMRNEVLTKM